MFKLIQSKGLKFFIIWIMVTNCLHETYGQIQHISKRFTEDNLKVLLEDLYQPGISVNKDSVFISEEAQLLLESETYRSQIYPRKYTWEKALELVKKQDIKQACWYFINLYSLDKANRNLVLESILLYNKVLLMDKALVGSFYTYCLIDPETSKMINGKSEIYAPHIFEKKLNALKEIILYIKNHEK